MMRALVIAALCLPLVTMAGVIALEEHHLRSGVIRDVPIQGYDPRDILRGQYIRWAPVWHVSPGVEDGGPVALCVGPGGVLSSPAEADNCAATINGHVRKNSRTGEKFFNANGLNNRFYVPEDMARPLETMLMAQNHDFAMRIAFLPGRDPRIVTLLIDGQPWHEVLANAN